MQLFTFDLLGLKSEKGANNDAREEAYGKVVDMVLNLRAKAKADKDWATSDQIRDALAEAGFEVKDTKDGVNHFQRRRSCRFSSHFLASKVVWRIVYDCCIEIEGDIKTKRQLIDLIRKH